jgi:outer membrane protein OmpA-like peptidoglycan-associated protein
VSNSNRDPKDFPSDEPIDDWGKTNYNFSSKQSPPADEWGKTAVNINVPRGQPEDDFGKTMPPSQPRRDNNWDATQANINIPRNNYEQESSRGGGRGEPEYGATTPYFQLPESERAKYQNLPPAEPPQTGAENNKKKGGIPTWLWAVGGLSGLFLFAVAAIFLVWYFFIPKTGFELIVKGAPAGSEIFVDGQRWSLSTAEGTYRLPGLKSGEQKIIEIKHAGFKCEPQKISGENGSSKEMIAQCVAIAVTPPVTDDCGNIKKGDFAKAAKCANAALDNLKDPFTVEDLLKAMNLYIINFPSGKYDIVKPEDKAFIQKAAGYIQKLPPNVVIEVGGHTDNVGKKPSNQILSDNRAKSVKTALIAAGVKETVLQTKGYGDSKPKPGNTNANEDEKFQNRRIEYSKLSP